MHRLYTLFENLETKCVDTGMNFYILYSEFVKVHIQRNVTINFWLKLNNSTKYIWFTGVEVLNYTIAVIVCTHDSIYPNSKRVNNVLSMNKVTVDKFSNKSLLSWTLFCRCSLTFKTTAYKIHVNIERNFHRAIFLHWG